MRRRASWNVLLLVLGVAGVVCAQDPAAEAARTRYHEALRRRPTHGALFERWRAAALAHGSSDGWLREVRERAERDDAVAGDHVLLAWVHRHRGEWDLADAASARAVGLAPDDPAVLAARARLLAERGRDDDALPCFERALERAPSPSERLALRRELFALHLRQGRLGTALALLDDGALEPADELALREDLAAALQARSLHEPARTQWEWLAARAPDPTRRVEAGWHIAECLEAEGRGAEARAALERLHATLDPRSWIARATLERLERSYLREGPEAWLAHLERACRERPDDLERARRHAQWLARCGRPDDAARRLAGWIERLPGSADLQRERIAILRDAGRFDACVDALERFVAAFPGRPEGLLELGDALRSRAYARTPFALDDVLAARDHWLAVGERWPTDWALHVQVAERLSDLVRSLAAREETSALRAALVDQVLDAHRSARRLAQDPLECGLATLDFLADRDLRAALEAEIVQLSRELGDTWSARARLAAWARRAGRRTAADDWVQQHLLHHGDDDVLRLAHAEHLLRVAPGDAALAEHVARLAARPLHGDLLERTVRLRLALLRDDPEAGRLRLAHAAESGRASAADLWCLALLEERRDPERAARRLEEAFGRAPEEEALGRALAQALGRARRDEAEARTWAELARRFPANADPHREAEVHAWLRAERLGRAREVARDLFERHPEHAGRRRLLAAIELQLGHVETGRELLRGALGRDPSNLEVRLALVDAVDDETALALLVEGLEHAPDAQARGLIAARLAVLVREAHDPEPLRMRVVQDLETRRPTRGTPFVSRALADFHRGLDRRGDEAAELARLHALDPADFDLLRELVENARQRGASAEALRHQERLVSLAPTFAARLGLAALALECGAASRAAWLLAALLRDGAPLDEAFLDACDALLCADPAQAELRLAELLRERADAWPLRLRSLLFAYAVDPERAAAEAGAWLPSSPPGDRTVRSAPTQRVAFELPEPSLRQRGNDVPDDTGSTVLASWQPPRELAFLTHAEREAARERLHHVGRLSPATLAQRLDDVLADAAHREDDARTLGWCVRLHVHPEAWRAVAEPDATPARLRELLSALFLGPDPDAVIAVARRLVESDAEDAWTRYGLLAWYADTRSAPERRHAEGNAEHAALVVACARWAFARHPATAAALFERLVPVVLREAGIAPALALVEAFRGAPVPFRDRAAVWRACQRIGSGEPVRSLARDLMDTAERHPLTNAQRTALAAALLEPEDDATWEFGWRTFLALLARGPDASTPEPHDADLVTFPRELVPHAVPLRPVGPAGELDPFAFALLERLARCGSARRDALADRLAARLDVEPDPRCRRALDYAACVVAWRRGELAPALARLEALVAAAPDDGSLALQRARLLLARGDVVEVARWAGTRASYPPALEAACRAFETELRRTRLVRDARALRTALLYELERARREPPDLAAFLPTWEAVERLATWDERGASAAPCAPLPTPSLFAPPTEGASWSALHDALDAARARYPEDSGLLALAVLRTLVRDAVPDAALLDAWLAHVRRRPAECGEPAGDWIADLACERASRSPRAAELAWAVFAEHVRRRATPRLARAFDRLLAASDPEPADDAALLERAHALLCDRASPHERADLAPLERLVELTDVHPLVRRRAWHPTLVRLASAEQRRHRTAPRIAARLLRRSAEHWSHWDEATRHALLEAHRASFFLAGDAEPPSLGAWTAHGEGLDARAPCAAFLRLAERDGQLHDLRRAWREHPHAEHVGMLELRILAAHAARDRVEAEELERRFDAARRKE